MTQGNLTAQVTWESSRRDDTVYASLTLTARIPGAIGAPDELVTLHCVGTLTPMPTVDEELALYGVRFTASPDHLMTQWTPERKQAVRNAVVDIANRFGGAADFRAVYEHIDFEWCIAGASDCADIFGWAYDDHIVKFGGIYTNEVQATRLVVHELGHVFDRMVCASRRTNGECDDPNHNSARTDLQDVWNTLYCGRDEGGNSYHCLSRNTHAGPQRGLYWGFAGGWEEWQFGATHGPGEVWADMFLSWVYDEWGDDRFGTEKRRYMNAQMSTYLNAMR